MKRQRHRVAVAARGKPCNQNVIDVPHVLMMAAGAKRCTTIWSVCGRLGEWRRAELFPGLLLRHISSSVPDRCPLSAGENYQVLASDKKTIVCYHPPKQVPYSEAKPLRRRREWKKDSLTHEEATLVRKLRQEDGFTWSVATLSRFFNVSPAVISRVAPATPERQVQLDEERRLLAEMRPHKRKLYLLQRQKIREDKIKEVIAAKTYPLPALNNGSP